MARHPERKQTVVDGLKSGRKIVNINLKLDERVRNEVKQFVEQINKDENPLQKVTISAFYEMGTRLIQNMINSGMTWDDIVQKERKQKEKRTK